MLPPTKPQNSGGQASLFNSSAGGVVSGLEASSEIGVGLDVDAAVDSGPLHFVDTTKELVNSSSSPLLIRTRISTVATNGSHARERTKERPRNIRVNRKVESQIFSFWVVT